MKFNTIFKSVNPYFKSFFNDEIADQIKLINETTHTDTIIGLLDGPDNATAKAIKKLTLCNGYEIFSFQNNAVHYNQQKQYQYDNNITAVYGDIM